MNKFIFKFIVSTQILIFTFSFKAIKKIGYFKFDVSDTVFEAKKIMPNFVIFDDVVSCNQNYSALSVIRIQIV